MEKSRASVLPRISLTVAKRTFNWMLKFVSIDTKCGGSSCTNGHTFLCERSLIPSWWASPCSCLLADHGTLLLNYTELKRISRGKTHWFSHYVRKWQLKQISKPFWTPSSADELCWQLLTWRNLFHIVSWRYWWNGPLASPSGSLLIALFSHGFVSSWAL